MHGWQSQVTSDGGRGEACGTEPLTCGIWCYLWVRTAMDGATTRGWSGKNQSALYFIITKSPSCVRLSVTPGSCSPPSSSVHEISQARILEWVAISYPRGSSRPRNRTSLLPHWQAESLLLSHIYLLGGVQSLSCIRLCVTLWTAARQASLSFTISQSLLKLTSIESVMPWNRLILCCPLLLLSSILPSIRVLVLESF